MTMTDSSMCRTRMEVDLDSLRQNFLTVKEKMKNCRVMGVVKANAYGLGVHPVAQTLKDTGAAGLCVATWQEASELLKYDLPIQILGAVFDFELPHAVVNNAILGITDLETAERFSAEAVRQNRSLECHIKLDTGMGRLGILYYDAVELIRKICALPNLKCKGIYSHFPQAYAGEESFAAEQLKRFLNVLEGCHAAGIDFEKIHMANSDGIQLFDRTGEPPFNYARAGLTMYHGANPVVKLCSRLAAVRKMPAGYTIGYERTCTLKKDSLVGTIAAGYADGLPLALSNRGFVSFRGKRCPVLGRISMDYTTILLDGIDDPQIGGDVTLFGDELVRADEWAALKGSHVYDIFCSISSRVKRFYR